MTRKRFVKRLMAEGCSRNCANILAYLPRNDRMDIFLIARKVAAGDMLLRLGYLPAGRDEVAHE